MRCTAQAATPPPRAALCSGRLLLAALVRQPIARRCLPSSCGGGRPAARQQPALSQQPAISS
jgi:hypothetical protein